MFFESHLPVSILSSENDVGRKFNWQTIIPNSWPVCIYWGVMIDEKWIGAYDNVTSLEREDWNHWEEREAKESLDNYWTGAHLWCTNSNNFEFIILNVDKLLWYFVLSKIDIINLKVFFFSTEEKSWVRMQLDEFIKSLKILNSKNNN